MFNAFTVPPQREWMKWCAFALVLIAPGSFVVLPLLWLWRLLAMRTMQPKTAPFAEIRTIPPRGDAPINVA